MANLTDNPAAEWTNNEVYEIAGADRLSGAFTGAENGGIGILNQPHQQLANRTAFLKGRQDTNITNIATLLAFVARFSGTLGPAGSFIQVPFLDSARGQINLILQFGKYSASLAANTDYVVTWPKPFPNTCLWAAPVALSNASDQAVISGTVIPEAVSFNQASGRFKIHLIGNFIATLAGFYDGFLWVAAGF